MSPLSIRKILQMLYVVSISNNTLLTIFGSCRPAHNFNSFSRNHYKPLCDKNLYPVISAISFQSHWTYYWNVILPFCSLTSDVLGSFSLLSLFIGFPNSKLYLPSPCTEVGNELLFLIYASHRVLHRLHWKSWTPFVYFNICHFSNRWMMP
jgi:hypothetical protein